MKSFSPSDRWLINQNEFLDNKPVYGKTRKPAFTVKRRYQMGNKLVKSRTKVERPPAAICPRRPLQPLKRTINGVRSIQFSNFPRTIAQFTHKDGNGLTEETEEEVHCCTFAPDDESLIVTCTTPCGPTYRPGEGFGHLRVFDITSGLCMKEILTYNSQQCDISADGDLITFVMNSGRGEVALVRRSRDSRSGIAERVEKFQPCCTGITGQTLSCKFSPDASHIVSAASLDFHSIRETNELRLWNVKSMQTVKKVVLRDLTDFCGFVTSCEFSPDGQYIAVSTSQEQLCILRSKNFDIVAVLRKRCRGNKCWSVFDPRWKCEILACCLQDGRVEIWQKIEHLSTCDVRYVCDKQRKVSFSRRLYSCRYSPDGMMLAVGTSDANIIVLDSGNLESLFCLDSKSMPDPYRPRNENTIVDCIAFSRSQQYVAAGYSDGLARIWAMPVRFDLKHLCRVVILHSVAASKISCLPIPSGIKTYLLNRCS